jgi:hypothetical protein
MADPSTKALYNFNEASGSTAVDSTGNGYHGAINGATYSTASICVEPPSVLSFDGVDDYVDLGSTIANGLRTIEMWFKLGTPFTSSSPANATLFGRDNSTEVDELFLQFQGASAPSPGRLGFSATPPGTSNYQWAYSDSTSWDAGVWYHVAGVIDPVQGMMLFINGVKQANVNPTVMTASGSSSDVCVLGRHGALSFRYFDGRIDDVRLSTTALYDANFDPECPDAAAKPSTVALYQFNERIGTLAVDSSLNGNTGSIHGANRQPELVCINTGQEAVLAPPRLLVYPNPAKETAFVAFGSVRIPTQILVVDAMGRTVHKDNSNGSLIRLDVSAWPKGSYHVQLISGATTSSATLLIQ